MTADWLEEEGMRRHWRVRGYDVALVEGGSEEHLDWERALLETRGTLPLTHRHAWAEGQAAGGRSMFLGIADAGRAVGGAAVQVARSRALPGHRVLRCERFGPGVAPEARAAALDALAAAAREHRRVLRLTVETYGLTDAERLPLENAVRARGFRAVEPPRCYDTTLVLDLARDEQAIFADLHKTARQNIRAAAKFPIEVRPIDDPIFFRRLDAIATETYARTGGSYSAADWGRIARLGRASPAVSRLLGVFRTDLAGPESLLAFAWGCNHGDHAEYSRAGSTRPTDLRRLPLAYPLMWELIRWARENGARVFDFGGVTAGSQQTDDPLGGISDFKRYFSQTLVRAGAEWALEPRVVQARAARVMSSASGLLSRVLPRA